MPSIKRAALVEPAWNWPQLIGGPFVRALDEATIDHDLCYDALAVDLIELRSSSEWRTGECGRGQQRSRGDRRDA
jgi:hypothetical protein